MTGAHRLIRFGAIKLRIALDMEIHIELDGVARGVPLETTFNSEDSLAAMDRARGKQSNTMSGVANRTGERMGSK